MRVLALWAIAALLALFVATHQPPPQDADLPVLVTRQFIPAGTSSSQIAAGKMVAG